MEGLWETMKLRNHEGVIYYTPPDRLFSRITSGYSFRVYIDTIKRYTIQAIRTIIPVATELRSLIQPTIKGITAPPDIAIIISPEISLLLEGYF